MLTFEEFANIVYEKNVCLFFGAGISVCAGLPIGNTLGAKILFSLGLTDIDAKETAGKFHLERMLFLLKEFLGEKVIEAYNSLDVNDYGINHQILGKLYEEKDIPLLTTNQDILIEKCLTVTRNPSTFIKIHGTINDQKSLRVTLDKTSKLAEKTAHELEGLVQNKIIITIGYSFSDWDLKPFFKKHRKNVYCYAHENLQPENLLNVIWENDSNECSGHCFVSESSSKSILTDIANLFGVNVEYSLPKDENELCEIANQQIDSTLAKWSSKFNIIDKKLALNNLSIGLWQGGETATKDLNNIISNDTISVFSKVLLLYQRSKAAEMRNEYGIQLNTIKKIGEIEGVSKKVKKYFQSLSLSTYHHIQDTPLDSFLGLYNFLKAKRLLQYCIMTENEFRSMENYKFQIDFGIASCLEKLSRYFFLRFLNRISQKIVDYYIFVKNNIDIDILSEFYFIYGKLFVQKGSYEKAKIAYIEALSIAQWIKKEHSIDQANRGLGRISVYQKDYRKAEKYFDESLKVAKKTKELKLIARNYITRAWAYKRMGLITKAREYKKKGYLVYQIIYRKNTYGKKNIFGEIRGCIQAALYFRRGR